MYGDPAADARRDLLAGTTAAAIVVSPHQPSSGSETYSRREMDGTPLMSDMRRLHTKVEKKVKQYYY
jgi:hypothetical protein